jgi:hypothetical protein
MKQIAMYVLLSFFFWSSSNAEGQVAPPLKLKLTTKTAAPCSGAPFKIEAELVNESKEKVAVDVKTIWHQISFTLFRRGSSHANSDGGGSGRNAGGSKTIVSDAGPNYQGGYLILSPGEVYKATRIIKLDDGFFSSPGAYNMKVSYGQFMDKSFEGIILWKDSIESNILNFKMANCKNKKILAAK